MAVTVALLGGWSCFCFVRGDFLRIMARYQRKRAGEDLPLPLRGLHVSSIGLNVDALKNLKKVVHLPLHPAPVVGGQSRGSFGQRSQECRQAFIYLVELVVIALLEGFL